MCHIVPPLLHEARWPPECTLLAPQAPASPDATSCTRDVNMDRAAATFRVYADVDASGCLGHADMVAALAEMGAHHGMSTKMLGEGLDIRTEMVTHTSQAP